MKLPLRNYHLSRSSFFKTKTAQRRRTAGEESFTDRQRQIDFINLGRCRRGRAG